MKICSEVLDARTLNNCSARVWLLQQARIMWMDEYALSLLLPKLRRLNRIIWLTIWSLMHGGNFMSQYVWISQCQSNVQILMCVSFGYPGKRVYDIFNVGCKSCNNSYIRCTPCMQRPRDDLLMKMEQSKKRSSDDYLFCDLPM